MESYKLTPAYLNHHLGRTNNNLNNKMAKLLAFLFIAAVVLAVASAQYLAAYPRAGLVGAPLYTGAGLGYAGLGYRGLGAYPGYGYGGAIYG